MLLSCPTSLRTPNSASDTAELSEHLRCFSTLCHDISLFWARSLPHVTVSEDLDGLDRLARLPPCAGQPLQYMPDAFDQEEATRVARETKRDGARVLLLFLSISILDADANDGMIMVGRRQVRQEAW